MLANLFRPSSELHPQPILEPLKDILNFSARAAFLILLLVETAAAAELAALPAFLRPDPFGGIVAADQKSPQVQAVFNSLRNPLTVAGARGGYLSFQLVAKIPEGGDFNLAVKLEDASGKLQLDLFREWFHFNESDKSYYPDALIPVSQPYASRIPDPDNRIDKQTVQAFWVDIWVGGDSAPGPYRCQAVLQTGRKRISLPVNLTVVDATIPAEDVVLVDHNSYGSSFLARQYVNIKVPSEDSFRLTHLYHRIFYEHRGVFHQLGYGHGGKVIPEFAPGLAGTGRTKQIKSWDLYDRHYGPLLDGTAFSGSRRGARPIPFVYLPINPEWPASFLWWGEPGYEAEFTNVLSQMERHFREKGWTQTRFEMFFNHKKRYKAFPWDGDEVRFPDDDRFFIEYGRLLKKALPADSPVKFVFRADASWTMERQFRSLAGIVNFWVCGGGMFGWYPEAVKLLKGRGDIVWIYGGAPPVTSVSTAITESILRAWVYGVDGWVHWQTVDPGEDPWFHLEGGSTVLAYSGDRFGIKGPIATIRLKLQRNCVQDITLLDSFKSKRPLETLKSEATERYNGTKPSDWWNARPALADTNPIDWSNGSIDEAIKASTRGFPGKLSPAAWENVHRFVMQIASEGR